MEQNQGNGQTTRSRSKLSTDGYRSRSKLSTDRCRSRRNLSTDGWESEIKVARQALKQANKEIDKQSNKWFASAEREQGAYLASSEDRLSKR